MTDEYTVILNAQSGKIKGQAKIDLVEQALQSAGVAYRLQLTQYRGHGLEIARQAAQEGRPAVVAVGGDGTIHEIVNGLLQGAADNAVPTLGIIPLGSANDLASVLQLPQDVQAACVRLALGNSRLIDVGTVNDHYFVNNSAVGLEPVVTITQDQMRQFNGSLRYVLAALKVIASAQTWEMRLDWGSGMYEGPVVLVSVGNSPRTGGVFYMTPQAEVDNGLLDFVFAVGMRRDQMMRLLPKIFNGSHIHHPLVTYLKTQKLTITATPATPIQADGEIIDETALEITYQILPKHLRVIV